MIVKEFFDPATYTLTYIVFDQNTKDAIIIDPVWDYKPEGSVTSTESAQQVIEFITSNSLQPHYVLETHAHADHLSAAQILKEKFPNLKIGIHESIKIVQSTFKEVYNFTDDFDTSGANFDLLLKSGQSIEAGSLKIKVIPTPGHTPACASFYINEKIVFTGDALFMPDYGVGRCDFPKGDAKQLYLSVTEGIYTLPDDTEVYTGHDYQPGGRELRFKSTVKEEKQENIHINVNTSKDDFVKMRTDRDATLNAPRLLLPSIQVNIQAGKLLKAEKNGKHYLKIPINAVKE